MRMAVGPCPSCSQTYLKSGLLGSKLIYIHRESDKGKPIDYCTSRTGKGKIGKIVKEELASHTSDVVNMGSSSNLLDNTLKGGEEKIQMAAQFTGFNKTKLAEKFPSAFGRGRVTTPSVSIGEQGRIQLSTEVSKALAGCTVILPAWAAAERILRVQGYETAPKGKEEYVWDITRPKDEKKGKQASFNGGIILKEIGYDFKKAGNQTYPVTTVDVVKHVVVITLPAELPAKKAAVKRASKKKAEVAPATTAAVVNGVATPSVPPAGGADASNTDEIEIDT